MVLGFPLYGRTFTLSSSQTGPNAPASGPGTPGTFTREAGFLAYFEVARRILYILSSSISMLLFLLIHMLLLFPVMFLLIEISQITFLKFIFFSQRAPNPVLLLSLSAVVTVTDTYISHNEEKKNSYPICPKPKYP